MKIKKIKINGFGKLKNKEINFDNNINLIYGKNENGKTTLLKFICGMLYGISKNKNGREMSDFDRYMPWDTEEFSGKLVYELDNKKTFEIFREFKKKSPQIYDENSKDITKEFNIDKNKGSLFFNEQTGIDEELFLNTAVSAQKENILDKSTQNILIQKLTNLVSTGDDNISYKKTMEKLNKKLVEEVGNERTAGRPLNLIQENIKKIQDEKDFINENSERILEIEKEKKELEKNKNQKQKLIEKLKNIKKIKEDEKYQKEKIKINEEIIKEYNEKIEKQNSEFENDTNKNKYKVKPAIVFFIIILINIIFLISLKISLISIIVFGVSLIISLLYLNLYNKEENKKRKINEHNESIKKQINILEENKKNQEKEIDKLNEKINKIYENYKEENFVEYKGYSNEEIEKILENSMKEYNSIELKQNILNIENKNITNEIENKIKKEEELEILLGQKEELEKHAEAINFAKEILEKSYSDMKNTVTPRFTKKLSEITNKVSEGKYNNIKFKDENGLLVELENGEYVNCSRLSTGTIEQMYLALRLSAIDEISDEEIPIILDETFVYYDDERLKNMLKYLSENYSTRQFLIFSCSEREKSIMDKENIKYNYICI